MAWAFVGVGTVVTVTATGHTLTEPAGCQAGDLLVAVISSRIASTTSITLPSGWALVAESKTNNVVAAAVTSEASGMMAYIVRGDTAPALTFTHPTAPSVAMGRIVAYRGGNIWSPFDVGIGAKTGTSITAVSTTGLTTGEANELIVKGVCSGRASAFSAHDAATDPTTSSGTSSVQTAAPIVGTWQERQDSSTTTGADTALAIADAIRGTAGATGVLTCTATVSGGHAQVAGAFRIEPTAVPAGSPVQIIWSVGVPEFIASDTNSGTVSSTINVPSDTELVCVGLQSWSSEANYFTNMTFTKGGADTAMTRVGTTEPGNGQTAAIFYLASPDTGANKSLKFDWAGTNAPGETPMISVSFWKNVDTASPVRSSGASLPAVSNAAFKTRSGLLTAQASDLVVGFVGGDCGGPAEHTVDTWYNLDPVYQCANAATIRHDGAWGIFPPSTNLYVGADTSSGMQYGVCAAIVVKPKPAATPGTSTITQTGSATQFSAVTGNSGTLSVTVPADAQIAVVGVLGRSDDTGFFDTAMTLTKGGTDVAMTRVGPTGQTSSQTPVIYYLALPDTGAGKSLKYNWTGANVPPAGAEPTISVTYWKGIDTASPVRSSGWQGELAERFSAVTDTLTAQDGDLVVGFAGGYGPGSEGSIDTWYNLNTLSQWTFSGPHDAAWGTFAPSGNLKVGAIKATNLQYGVCAAIVLKPTPSKLVSYARNGTNTVASPLTVTFPATLAGDCLIYVGIGNGTAAMTVQADTGAAGVHGTLGGVQTPRASSAGVNFSYIVGLIAAPAAGTTSVSLSCSNATLEKELAVWVVRGLTNPTQDKGVYSIGQGPGTLLVSGLTGTLAAAEEFAVAYGVAMEESTTGINTAQTGSSGFVADQVTTPIFGSSFSHQDTTSTTQIQSAFNQSGGMGDALCATYYSGPSGVTGTFSPTDSPDTAVGWTGTVAWLGTLDTTDTADTAAFTGTVAWTGILDVRDDADTAAFTGEVAWLAILLVTDPADVAALLGDVIPVVEGTLLVTDAPDIADFTGDVVPYTAGVLDTTDDPDTAAFSGVVEWWAILDATDSPDIAAFTGVILIPLDGILDATDPSDIAAFTGEVISYLVLDATDQPDTMVFNGLVLSGVGGILDATEDADTASFISDVINNMTLDATDDPDIAAFTGTVLVAGTLTATDVPDTAAFTGAVTVPVPFTQTTIIG